MNMMRLALGLLFFILFFGGSLVEYGLLPGALNSALPDAIIAGLFLAALLHAKKRGHGLRVVGGGFCLFLIAWTGFSLVVADGVWLSGVLFLRLLLRFYLLFIALINIGLSERDQRWCLQVLTVLFVLQIPVAVAKLFVYGQGESAIGSYATHGGGYSTAIPMVAAAFLVSYFLAYRRRPLYLLLLLGFIAFGLIGGKRAIFLMVPLTGGFCLWLATRLTVRSVLAALRYLVPLSLVFGLVVYFAVRLSPTLTPERRVMGSFDLEHLAGYVMASQVTAYSEEGSAQGRYSTTLVFMERVNDDLYTALFGFGPGLLLKTRFEGAGREQSVDDYGMRYGGALRGFNVVYGITGFVWLLAQIGWPGTLVWLGFYLFLLVNFQRFAREERDPFWIAYFRGLAGFAFVVLLISLIYGAYLIMGDLLTFTFFLLAGIGFIHRSARFPRTVRA